jgi:hypothetical protein
MLMIWIFGHWSLFVIVVGFFVLAALAMFRIALHAASYVEMAPIRVRPGRKGLSS